MVLRAVGELVDKLLRLRKLDGLRKALIVRRRFALAKVDIVADAAGEEHRLLRHVAELVVECVERVVPDVHAIDKHLALRRIVKARDQAHKCRLAAARRADDGKRLAPVHTEADVRKLILRSVRIAERNVFELHCAVLFAFAHAALADIRLALEHLVDTLGRDLRLRQQHEDHHEHHKRHHHVGCIRAEHQHVAEHREARCGIGQRDVVDERRTQPVDRERQAVHTERHRRLDEGEELLVLYLHIHHVKARLVELVVLVLLGVERVHHVDARQVFARHTVDLVGQLLHDAETRDADAHHRYHRHADDHDECRCHGGEFPALAENFDDGPHGHDRRFDHHLQAHRHDHLNLRDVVRRSRDEAGDGKILHLLAADVHHVAEELFAHREAEARRRLSRKIPAAHGQHGACERAAKHFHADGQDIRRRPRRFDERRQIGHVIRQPQVKVDLHRHKHGAQQHHEHLFTAHVFE